MYTSNCMPFGSAEEAARLISGNPASTPPISACHEQVVVFVCVRFVLFFLESDTRCAGLLYGNLNGREGKRATIVNIGPPAMRECT